MVQELSSTQVRHVFDQDTFDFTTTEGLPPLDGITGQSRAVAALEFGLGVSHRGFNVYVAGAPGTGKMTAVRNFLEELARNQETPPDICYVNNFVDAYRPLVLELPAGLGCRVRDEMAVLVQRVQEELPRAFESSAYAERSEAFTRDVQKEREEFLSNLNERARAEGFTIQTSPIGIAVVPVLDGHPMADQEFLALDPEHREDLRAKREVLEQGLQNALKEMRGLERTARDRLKALNGEIASYVIGLLIEDMAETYVEVPQIRTYLDQVKEDMVTHMDQFLPPPTKDSNQRDDDSQMTALSRDHALRKYEINVVVDNADTEGIPVIVELNPTYNNLFGRLEKESILGAVHTDFTLIRGGALHRANGGFLVVPVEELLRNPFAYESLKHALNNQRIVIEEMGERMGMVVTKSLQAQPVPLKVKAVLVGSTQLYHLLYQNDEDFPEQFKVKADFDTQMDRNDANTQDYIGFICALCEKEQLNHLDRSAVAKLIEQGSRLADDQQKLSTRFSELADVIREADHHARRAGAECITGDHVREAIQGRIARSNLIEERIQEMMNQGMLLIDTKGERVGQINGLAVLGVGDYSFGRPSRITVSIGLGQSGLLDIEREARLGGPLHTKGVLILGGFLTQRYSQDKPLSLTARLVFEQSYDGVDGDSASSTELYAILSSLSGLPIKQTMAVTGSVNQNGEVQAIGGVNEKVEGFYDHCVAQGLVEGQGVLIPASNARNLMLREDVVQAVADGKYHIYPIETIDQGIEILTGTSAGERGEDGTYPENSINALVDAKLKDLAETLRTFGRPRDDEDEKKKPDAQEDDSPDARED